MYTQSPRSPSLITTVPSGNVRCSSAAAKRSTASASRTPKSGIARRSACGWSRAGIPPIVANVRLVSTETVGRAPPRRPPRARRAAPGTPRAAAEGAPRAGRRRARAARPPPAPARRRASSSSRRYERPSAGLGDRRTRPRSTSRWMLSRSVVSGDPVAAAICVGATGCRRCTCESSPKRNRAGRRRRARARRSRLSTAPASTPAGRAGGRSSPCPDHRPRRQVLRLRAILLRRRLC